MSKTKKRGRGYGECLGCKEKYSRHFDRPRLLAIKCRRKPESCGKCGRFHGGRASQSVKKKKTNSPDSVEITLAFFSVKSSTRGDCCLVV